MMQCYKKCTQSRHNEIWKGPSHWLVFSASFLEWGKFSSASFGGVVWVKLLPMLPMMDHAMSRLFLTLAHARFLNRALSSLHILAASTLAGDSVFGSASMDITDRRIFFNALNRTPPFTAAFIPKGVGTRGVEDAYTHPAISVDVGVEEIRFELHFWWVEGVILREGELCNEHSIFKVGALRSCDCRLPVKEVLLCDGAHRNPIRGVLRHLLVLGHQPPQG